MKLKNKMFQTEKQKIGEFGENFSVKHFVKHGYKILDRNYRRKWGELDIVAEKNKILHFIEVKTIKKNFADLDKNNNEEYQPEENVHFWKRQRMARIIKTYILDKKIPEDMEWQIDVAAVFLDLKIRRARIRITENIILL